MIGLMAYALALAGSATVQGRDQPLYKPEAAWIRPIPIPADVKPSGAATDVLLWSAQDRLAPGDDESFVEQATRINAPEGLQQAGNLLLTWNPVTDSLTIHRARILRGGRTIDLLAGGKTFTVLRRESNLEAAMIDGELTATLQPEGLQVGDVLDLAYTVSRDEPALAGHSEGGAFVGHAGTIGRLYVRTSWPAGRSFRTWKTDDLPAVAPVTRDGWTEVGFDQTGAVSPDPPKGAFTRDRLFGILAVGDFKDWAEVSATAYSLYAKAATLAPDSPLVAEIARLRAASPDPKARALAALERVESQTRYLYVGLDAGGYTPAAADLTWTRRFGDCKGKTVLLLALLHGLGVEAEPALVNTGAGDGLERQLPQMGAFDHVLVRAEIEGRIYWLDATRMGDENLDVLTVPSYHWALPVRPGGAGLEALTPKDLTLPMAESVLKVDARGGIDKPATVHEEMVFRGDLALGLNMGLKQASRIDSDRALRKALTAARSWIEPDKVGFVYDPQRMEGRATLDGTGTPPFSSAGGGAGGLRDWLIEGSDIGSEADLTRTSDYHRDAPFAVAYPVYARSIVQVELPNEGKGFETFNGETVDRTAAGVAYNRTAAITGGRLVMVSSAHSVAASFPASQAASAQQALHDMADYQVSIRYTPPAAKTAGASAAPARPKDTDKPPPAEGAEARAAQAYLARSYAEAEAEYTTAIVAHPSAKLHYDRAAARAAQGETAKAQDDLEAALKLDPQHALSLYALGRLALQRGDERVAAADFASATRFKPEVARMVAAAYESNGTYGAAASYWDRVAADATSPSAKASALNAACWTRAEGGLELDRAQQACDAALQLRPGAADVLDSRGLVDIRRRAFGQAVDDYSAALVKRPGQSTSLFGRALAEVRLGQADKAAADFSHAHEMDDAIEAKFGKWGLSR